MYSHSFESLLSLDCTVLLNYNMKHFLVLMFVIVVCVSTQNDSNKTLGDSTEWSLDIAVVGVDGSLYTAGDAAELFSIQSISKVFSLVQAIQHSGEEIWQRLGLDPLNPMTARNCPSGTSKLTLSRALTPPS